MLQWAKPHSGMNPVSKNLAILWGKRDPDSKIANMVRTRKGETGWSLGKVLWGCDALSEWWSFKSRERGGRGGSLWMSWFFQLSHRIPLWGRHYVPVYKWASLASREGMCKGPKAKPLNSASWSYKVKVNASGVWGATRVWGIQKDLGGKWYEGLISHWKDFVLKATGGSLGILGCRDTKHKQVLMSYAFQKVLLDICGQ